MKITIKCDKCGIEHTLDRMGATSTTITLPETCGFCPKEKTVDNAFLRCCGNCGNYKRFTNNITGCPVLEVGYVCHPDPSSVCSKWIPGEKGEVLG